MQSRLEKKFGKSRVFLVAIHVGADLKQAGMDIDVATGEGADGVILIRDGRGTNEDVRLAYFEARRRYPHRFIGVNLLGYKPLEVLVHAPRNVDGLWFDDTFAHVDKPESITHFKQTWKNAQTLYLEHPPLFLPSVAMKYLREGEDVAAAGRMVEPYADVIITTGSHTGVAAPIEKVKKLRAAVKVPIGLASGVSAENVEQFNEHGVNLYVINSSLNTDGKLDSKKVGIFSKALPR